MQSEKHLHDVKETVTQGDRDFSSATRKTRRKWTVSGKHEKKMIDNPKLSSANNLRGKGEIKTLSYERKIKEFVANCLKNGFQIKGSKPGVSGMTEIVKSLENLIDSLFLKSLKYMTVYLKCLKT